MPRKRKIYLLLRKKGGEICEFIKEQLRKKYIRFSKSPQMVLAFFVRKKNDKKCMI